MNIKKEIYLDTTIEQLLRDNIIDRSVSRACQSSKPPMLTAGDIKEHMDAHGGFSDVPGCRRGGRIADILADVAQNVIESTTPVDHKASAIKRRNVERLNESADFQFLTADQRREVLEFREKHGYLPMFKILGYHLSSPKASRNDTIMAYNWGFHADSPSRIPTLSGIAAIVGLSRERVRQIVTEYTLPEQLSHSRLWTHYADHSAYYISANDKVFEDVRQYEAPDMPFPIFAEIMQLATMLHNVDNKFLARNGWTAQISAWVNRFDKLMSMARYVDSRISIEGLAMGGSLDARMIPVVLARIAPSYGLKVEGSTILLPKNR